MNAKLKISKKPSFDSVFTLSQNYINNNSNNNNSNGNEKENFIKKI